MSSSTNHLLPATIDVCSLSLERVLRGLSMSRAADLLEELSQKAIARAEPPTWLLDALMREQLRFFNEHRAKLALRRESIFPLTSLSTYDLDYPRSIDRELCHRASSLEFIQEKANGFSLDPAASARLTWRTPSGSWPVFKDTE